MSVSLVSNPFAAIKIHIQQRTGDLSQNVLPTLSQLHLFDILRYSFHLTLLQYILSSLLICSRKGKGKQKLADLPPKSLSS